MNLGFARTVVLFLGAVSVGCAMCQTPFDYCGPVTDAEGCPNCNFNARRGSAYVPMDGIAATTEVGPKQFGEPKPSTPQLRPDMELPPVDDQELPPPSMSTAAPELDADAIFDE